MMYYRISKNEKNLFFGKKIAQVWAVTLRREIGRQFFRRKGDLFGLGRQVIIPCLCVIDKEPVLYP